MVTREMLPSTRGTPDTQTCIDMGTERKDTAVISICESNISQKGPRNAS